MLEYQLGLESDSYHYHMTPDAFARSFPFYVETYGYFNADETYYTKRDGLNNLLLIVTVAGGGRMQWKGQECILKKGSAVIIDCKTYQEYATLSGQRWAFFFVHFSAASMEGYRHLLLREVTPVTLRDPNKAVGLMKDLTDCPFENRALIAAAQSDIVSSLLTELTLSLSPTERNTVQSGRMEITDLADYIRTNCARSLHLEDFIAITHLSKHHLIRTFERQIGLSPYKYLHLCRIERAVTLLKNTEMSIAQIADAVGYNDPVVFIRHFKFFHKLPPGEYRRTAIFLPDH